MPKEIECPDCEGRCTVTVIREGYTREFWTVEECQTCKGMGYVVEDEEGE